MNRRVISVVAGLLALAIAIAPAQAPPSYSVTFTLEDGVAYTGATTFEVDAKSVVTGSMRITAPTPVAATLTGVIKDGIWTFEYAYHMSEQGCSGVVSGTAKVPADRKVISGTATIGGACLENPMSATFEFRRIESGN